MDATPPSIWKRPWRGPGKLLAWFALLVAACFIILCGIGLLTGTDVWGPQWMVVALLSSLVLVGLGTAGLWFIRWLCCWRNFRRFLFVGACLITLVALAYAEENWRGKHAWQTFRRESEAKGEKFDLAALAPPPVPDEKNFALTPLLKPVLEVTYEQGRVVWGDTNGLARLEKISAELSPHRDTTDRLSHGRDTNDHLVLGSLEKGTFANIPACAEFYRGNTNYPQAAATATPAEVILVALGNLDPELKELREAAASRADCRFPIPYTYEPSWGILLPHLARMKALTLLPQVRATAELEAGRPADAFEDLKLGLRFSDSIRAEPILIDHLVRIATLAIDLQTVREGLLRHAWTEGQLSELEKYLSSVDVLSEYQLAMRGERACSTQGLDYLRRQGFRSNPFDYLANGEGPSYFGPAFNPMPSGWFYQNMLTIARMHQDFTLPTVDERAHRVHPEISENGARALQELRTGPYTIFAKLLMPALEKAVRKSGRMQTYVDATRVACAVERYRLANGKLPDTLAALSPTFIDAIPNDVIDGKPLRYRPNPEGTYLLYSIGWNQTDDGGQLALVKPNHMDEEGKQGGSVDITKGDWVWQMAAR
ncbi:MAG TPA: hypothetical protein VN578_20275 [Candidatus Binatia bacterium]|jgi:hypothetical protein|nr:hypothetical protein [Candidatus Binatia bacterium]